MFDLNAKQGTNFEDVLEMNRSLVIRLVRQSGVCTRAQLSKMTGLQQASITKITAGLIKLKIIRETGIVEGEKGRRSIGIALCNDTYRIIGVKLDRDSFSVGLYDLSGNALKLKSENLFPSDSPQESLGRVKVLIGRLIGENSKIMSLGIAVCGESESYEQKRIPPPESILWKYIDVKRELERIFHLPVFVEYGHNAAALASWQGYEPKIESAILAYTLISESVQLGLVRDGELLLDSRDLIGIGHMSIDWNGRPCRCGSKGCLEGYCSSGALVKDVRLELKNYPDSELQGEEIRPQSVLEAAQRGDPLATAVVCRSAEYLAYALVSLVNILKPQAVVVGGVLAQGGQTILRCIQRVLKDRLLPELYSSLVVTLDTTADRILQGSALLAIDQFYNNPSAFLESH